VRGVGSVRDGRLGTDNRQHERLGI
jgi:hypothetical protein